MRRLTSIFVLLPLLFLSCKNTFRSDGIQGANDGGNNGNNSPQNPNPNDPNNPNNPGNPNQGINQGDGGYNPRLEEGNSGSDDGIDGSTATTTHHPQPCTVGAGTIISGNGMCPQYHASYTVDDGSTAKIGCCQLPAKDILKAGSPTVRQDQCGTDEIVVGVAGGNSLQCAPLNTDRYQLLAPQINCYYGSGSSGRGGAPKCLDGMPPSILIIVKDVMGSDGCVGIPYGALIVGRSGKTCGDTKSAQLVYRDTQQPVQMLP